MMADRTPEFQAIRDWIQTVVDETFGAGISVIFGRQAAPTLEGEHVLLFDGQESTVGQPMRTEVDEVTELATSHEYMRGFIEVTIVSERARAIGRAIVRRSSTPPDVWALSASGVAIVRAGNLVDASRAGDTVWEQRSAMTIEYTFFDSEDYAPGIIENAAVTGTVGGADVDASGSAPAP